MNLLILDTNCSDAGLSGILTVIKNALNLIHIIAPILLIIMASLYLFKLVINPDNTTSDNKKTVSKIKNSFIAAAVIFFIPTLVNIVMALVGNNTTVSECWNSVKNKIGSDTEYQEIDSKKKSKVTGDSSDYEKGKEQTSTETGTSTGSTGDIGEEVDATGTYYPALKGSGFRISGASYTGGCSENDKVVHDLNIKEGTPIYAGMDGTIEYSQYVCNGTLYSYGNQAKITDPTTGTYIIYAHLSKFVDAPTPVTATCAKSKGGPGCDAKATCGSVSRKLQGSRSVKRGELIGYTGNVGNSDGPHLHVEIHENGKRKCLSDPYKAMNMR